MTLQNPQQNMQQVEPDWQSLCHDFTDEQIGALQDFVKPMVDALRNIDSDVSAAKEKGEELGDTFKVMIRSSDETPDYIDGKLAVGADSGLTGTASSVADDEGVTDETWTVDTTWETTPANVAATAAAGTAAEHAHGDHVHKGVASITGLPLVVDPATYYGAVVIDTDAPVNSNVFTLSVDMATDVGEIAAVGAANALGDSVKLCHSNHVHAGVSTLNSATGAITVEGHGITVGAVADGVLPLTADLHTVCVQGSVTAHAITVGGVVLDGAVDDYTLYALDDKANHDDLLIDVGLVNIAMYDFSATRWIFSQDVEIANDLYLNSDGGTVYFGDSQDSSITDDGSNMIIHPDANGVGGRPLRIGADTHPFEHKGQDLGNTNPAWDDVYADDYNNVADFPLLDDKGDLAAILAIRPSGEVDPRSGLPLIDDASLPDWLLAKAKDGSGEILRGPDGKPYIPLKAAIALAWGAIRELALEVGHK